MQSPPIDTTLSATDIQSTTDLMKAPYEEIEYGRAVLIATKDTGDRILHSGRVVKRDYPFITLRRKSHRAEVNLEERNWKLDDWMPIRSAIERMQIATEYE